jgi:hypothetical protein
MKFKSAFYLLPLFFLVMFYSCKKDILLTDSSASVSFSKDSILFDTVFTQIGSTTSVFTVKNNQSQRINISNIRLGGGTSSSFKLNVDGVSGNSINDVELLAGDSMYVFVQVTINPNNSNSQLLVKDSIIFSLNGNTQFVYLTAVGQDVYLHKPTLPANKPWYSIIGCNQTWLNDKPHLIFGTAVVDSACTLTMLGGTRVYLYNKSNLLVFKDGSLIIQGTKNNEVTFQGTRLEPAYSDIAGQWGRIWLSPGSKNNTIDYAIIKNASIGVHVDTLGNSTNPTLIMNNTIIKNSKVTALFAQGSNVKATNCLLANSEQYLAVLNIGGKYHFEHCTFGNYWNASIRATPSLVINNYYVAANNTLNVRPIEEAYFGNCIIYGRTNEEIALDSTNLVGSGYFSYYFDTCLLKTALNTTNSTGHFLSAIKNQDPKFKDASIYDYRLDNGSPAIDVGNPSIVVPFDLNGNLRSGFIDIGAYEHQ